VFDDRGDQQRLIHHESRLEQHLHAYLRAPALSCAR
jgi:hypothetical protein